MSKKTEKKATKHVVKAVVKKETAKKPDAKSEGKKTSTKKADSKAKLTDNEIKNIVEMARTFRFFLLTLVPRQKSGSRGEAILKKVDECGRFISYVAERIGLSEIDAPLCQSQKKAKCDCGKCEKKADAKKTAKTVKKASNVKSSKK